MHDQTAFYDRIYVYNYLYLSFVSVPVILFQAFLNYLCAFAVGEKD